MAFAAIGSACLSMLVSAHVFRLLRKWGSLEHDVLHDSLTGLPNRPYFNSRLELAIELARTERRTLAVMFLDLDRFKNVNDSLGHAAGNSLLIQVARRLSASVDRTVTVARLAGDEFAILIPSVRNYKHTETIAKTMLEAFEDPFELGRRKVYVTPSIGVAHYPTDGMAPSELLEHADAAMYRAKERGRNTVELYTGERRKQATNRLDLESALHNAVDGQQLELYYQPKVNLRTGRVTGVEALLRWDHPILGPIPPDEFIPLAEESGLISLIGEWTLIEGCTQAKAWMDMGITDVSVAVNLSPRQFQLQRVQDLVARVLRLTHCPAALLELELTENLALQDPDRVGEVIDELHRMGVKCSIDDFGVGYSGLSYLARFSFDTIKIDRKFVDGIDDTGAPIVTAVIAMAKGLQLEVVAEGVETMAQLEFLRRHGCDTMQGYLFSRPLPARELEPILRKVLESPRAELVRNLSAF
jgi:diguanylate cyclase (GGDEF)-like protein